MHSRQIYIIPILCLFSLLSKELSSQEYYTSNHSDNLLYLNPSYSNTFNSSLLNINYRNQYPFSSYINYNASYFQNIESLHSNFGALLSHEQQNHGIFSHSSISLNYAYKFNISRNSYLSAGLRGGYNLSSVDYSALTFENGNGSYLESQSMYFPDFSFGITAIIEDKTFFGVSINHLFEPGKYNSEKIRRLYSISFSGKYNLSRSYNSNIFEPIVVLIYQEPRSSVYYGGNLYFFNFIGGVLLHQDFSFNFSYASILLGISYENYKIIYSYDLNLSRKLLFSHKMAAHEVTFLISLQYKDKRKKRGAIKCPKF